MLVRVFVCELILCEQSSPSSILCMYVLCSETFCIDCVVVGVKCVWSDIQSMQNVSEHSICMHILSFRILTLERAQLDFEHNHDGCTTK